MNHLTDKFIYCKTDFAREQIRNLITNFNVTVYSAAWRCKFLEALAGAGLDLRLYGKDWDKYPALAPFGRGPVDRGEPINAAINFSKINLHINHVNTMHQRVIECGLAGGFLMVADLPAGKDWEPARKYFREGEELVFFRTPAELIEKCRYYLAHPEERQRIAANLHARCRAEHTTLQAAGRILEEWRKRL